MYTPEHPTGNLRSRLDNRAPLQRRASRLLSPQRRRIRRAIKLVSLYAIALLERVQIVRYSYTERLFPCFSASAKKNTRGSAGAGIFGAKFRFDKRRRSIGVRFVETFCKSIHVLWSYRSRLRTRDNGTAHSPRYGEL